jgi:hypothetical protein
MIGDDIDAGMIWPAAWQNPERRGAVIEEVKRLLKNQAQRLLRRERPRAFPERLQGLARKRY